MAKKNAPAQQLAGNEMVEFVSLLAELSALDPSEFKRFGQRLRGARKKCSGNANEVG